MFSEKKVNGFGCRILYYTVKFSFVLVGEVRGWGSWGCGVEWEWEWERLGGTIQPAVLSGYSWLSAQGSLVFILRNHLYTRFEVGVLQANYVARQPIELSLDPTWSYLSFEPFLGSRDLILIFLSFSFFCHY